MKGSGEIKAFRTNTELEKGEKRNRLMKRKKGNEEKKAVWTNTKRRKGGRERDNNYSQISRKAKRNTNKEDEGKRRDRIKELEQTQKLRKGGRERDTNNTQIKEERREIKKE